MLRNGKNVTVTQAIGLANGPARDAKKSACVIYRYQRDGTKEEIHVDYGKIVSGEANDVTMLPNDILFVPANKVKSGLRKSLGDDDQRRNGSCHLSRLLSVCCTQCRLRFRFAVFWRCPKARLARGSNRLGIKCWGDPYLSICATPFGRRYFACFCLLIGINRSVSPSETRRGFDGCRVGVWGSEPQQPKAICRFFHFLLVLGILEAFLGLVQHFLYRAGSSATKIPVIGSAER